MRLFFLWLLPFVAWTFSCYKIIGLVSVLLNKKHFNFLFGIKVLSIFSSAMFYFLVIFPDLSNLFIYQF